MPQAGYRRKARRSSLGMVLGICLIAGAGCTVGPDFHRPLTPVPEAWRGLEAAPAGGVTAPQPEELVQWWEAFRDPTLSALVEQACQANLDLKLAVARVRQSRATRGTVAAGLWPQVNTSGSYTRSGTGSRPTSVSSETSGSEGGQPRTTSGSTGAEDLFRAGLDAAWELDLFGGVRRNVEAAEADIQAAVEDRRDVLVSLAAEVGTNYVDLRGFQQELAVARKNLAAQRHTAEITRKRFEAGYVGSLDVANANAQAATTESQIPVLESSTQAAIYSLSLLLGREPGALQETLAPEASIPPVPPQIPVGLPSDLLRRRPDIRRAEAQLHAATARIGVATADLFPKFSLTGNLGLSSNELSTFANWNNRAWSFGPSINWPLFSGGRIRANIEVQNALQEQALIIYEQTILTALREVETALVAYAKEQQHLASLTEAVRHNRKAVDAATQLYTAGKTDFLNVLNAQRALLATEEAMVQSTRTVVTHLIALYKALGGGWQEG